MKNYTFEKKCRICSNKNLHLILDLGKQPPANALIDKNQLSETEAKFPLRLFWCDNCYLVQLLDIVNKEYLFTHYLYMTGASKPIVTHFEKYAKDTFDEFLKTKSAPLVVEIGSNDGSLLSEFKKLGASILGIEPASNLSKLSNDSGIPTTNKFFSSDLASNIIKSFNPSLVVANNVVAHIENLHDLMNGVKILIGDNGVFIFEVPYLIDLIQNLEFDTIYHEHLSYFSIFPLLNLVDQFGLEIFDIKKQSVHGGTLRIFVSKKNNFKIKTSLNDLVEIERKFKLDDIKIYQNFANDVKNLKNTILDILTSFKSEKKSIIGYGATAKGNVLLNYCHIDTALLDYIVDTTPLKQGKFTPGTHIPIVSSDRIQNNVDAVLLLAWNYESDILSKEKNFRKNGGKFIIPLPVPEIK